MLRIPVETLFETKEEFERQLDWSPPSLYLFKVGDRQHPSAAVRLDPLPKAIFSRLPVRYEVFSPAMAHRRLRSTMLSVYRNCEPASISRGYNFEPRGRSRYLTC
jgi:hypothetical protein